MRTLTKINIIGCITVGLIVMCSAPTSSADSLEFDIDEFIDSPFQWEPDFEEGPKLGLTITNGECVDTYRLEDVSCADKAAIVSFRKAQNAELVERLKNEVKRLELRNQREDYGQQEC